MNAYPIVLSGLLASLPLLVALYMWRSGDVREEKGIFWGCIALAAFALLSGLHVTALLIISALVFGGCVLWQIVRVARSLIRAERAGEGKEEERV